MTKETQEALAQLIAEWQESPTKANASSIGFKNHADEENEVLVRYIEARMDEACASAAKG